MLPPYADLPDINALVDEGKHPKPPRPQPPLKPPAICGYRDVVCKRIREKKDKEKKVGLHLTPGQQNSQQVSRNAGENRSGWLRRAGRALSGAFSGLTMLSPTGNSFLPASGAGTSFTPGATAGALAAAAPPNFTSPEEAKLDPRYRTGGDGEDLFSGNYHWSLPLVSLPGRNGLDLNLTLHYNSLVWIRHSGNIISFDYDYYPTLTPGFRLGFPEISGPATTIGSFETYIVILPTGRRVALRKVTTSRYEATDSSYLYLVTSPSTQTMTLYATDGTQFSYTIPAGDWWYRCTQIKDRNGNFLTISYANVGTAEDPLFSIGTITDTLGRVINFNYQNQRLLSITQEWHGQTHTWAQFDYPAAGQEHPMTPNFGSLLVDGPGGGQRIPVITRVITGDGARHTFVYNEWGQAKEIWRYGEADNQRAALVYAFPSNSAPQTDCPRFTQRNDGIAGWAGQSYVNGIGWVSSYFSFDPNESYGEVTTPDGVTHKEFFSTTGGTRGLPSTMEDWFGGVKRKWTTTVWASDSATSPPLRPRVTELNVYDEAGNRRRTTIEYTTLAATVKLPCIVREYNADATTIYRSTQTEYVTSASYTAYNRRIIGLPAMQYLYQGDVSGTLVALTGFVYDSPNDTTTCLQAHSATPSQHDSTNYGAGFLARGNLTRVQRYSVTNGVASTPLETKTGYYTTGTVALTKDALSHQTSLCYDDLFLHYTQPTPDTLSAASVTPAAPTFAYPTRVTDPDGYSSTVSYNYDFGAVTRTVDPKEYALHGANPTTMGVSTYDSKGRPDKALVWKEGARYSQTRYAYATDHNWTQMWTTVNTLSEETYVVHLLDGASRERVTISEHPGSAGGLKSQYVVYGIMGWTTEWSNPTEIDGTWAPAGDDAGGYIHSNQDYDWKGRPTVTYNQDYDPALNPGSKRQISYIGCGCAGGDTVTGTDETGRKQKLYRDIFGRPVKTEVLSDSTTVYSSVTTDYDVLDHLLIVTEYAGAAGSGGASQQTAMTYDGYGRLKTRQRPQESAATTYNYYDDDRIQSSVDARGASGTLTYNGRGLLTQASYNSVAPTPTVTFQYDQNGRRTQMADGVGTVTYEYDSLSRLFRETRNFNSLAGRTYPLTYEYNLAGELTKITDPASAWVSYGRDRTGRVTEITGSPFNGVTSYAAGIAYRAWDVPKAASYGSGFSASAKYNSRLQVSQFDIPGVIGGVYTYNPDGQLSTFKAETPLSNQYERYMDRAFTYDAVGRMNGSKAGLDAGLGGWAFYYDYSPQYDEFGHIRNSSYLYWQNGTSAVQFSATYQNNKAVSISDAGQPQTWNYDAMGNRTGITQNSTTVEADLLDALGRVVNGPLDGNGQRVSPDTVSGYYVRSSALGGEVITQLDASGNKFKGRVLDGSSLIAEQLVAENKVQWHHRDPLNLVARDTEPGQVKKKTFLINPVGAQIESWTGVDITKYYSCLYQGQNNPTCSGFNPQPTSAYGYLADQANGKFGAGFKVDGALTLLSPEAAAAQAQRTGMGRIYISPALSGTQLANGVDGAFVRRSVSGWREVAGDVTKNGKYERNFVETIVDVWEFVPGASFSQSRVQVDPRFTIIYDLKDDRDVRSTAEVFYQKNPKCRQLIDLILGEGSVNNAIKRTTFVDVTKNPRAARLDAVTQIGKNNSSGDYYTLGEALTVAGGLTNTGMRSLIYVGRKYAVSSLETREMIVGHEMTHAIFSGNHQKIARSLGLHFTTVYGANSVIDLGRTEGNASAAINRFLKAGCDPFRLSIVDELLGIDPFEP